MGDVTETMSMYFGLWLFLVLYDKLMPWETFICKPTTGFVVSVVFLVTFGRMYSSSTLEGLCDLTQRY